MQIAERVVHQLHALFSSGLNDAWKHEGFCFANDVRHRRRVGERFQGENAAGAIGARNQLLTDDSAQRFADHDADLFLLIDGENIEQAIERARGVAGVQRAENKMAGLRRSDGE